MNLFGGLSFVGLIEKVWFGTFAFYISKIFLGRLNFADLVC